MADELSPLLRLAGPVIVAQLAWVALGVEDIVLAGWLSPEAVAAVSIGHLWSFGLLVGGYGLLRGLDPLFSQANGAGAHAEFGAVYRAAMRLAWLLAIPVMGWHLLPRWGLVALGQPAAVIPDAAAYDLALAFGVLPQLVFVVQTAALQARGHVRAPMVVMLAANVLNVVLGGVLMLGWWGGPAWGPFGLGVATTSVRWFMPLALGWLCRSELLFREAGPGLAPGTMALVRLGTPAAAQTMLEVWAFQLVGVFAGWLGPTALAAHAVALSISSVTFMVPYGIGTAAAIRVGNLVGAGRPWFGAAWRAVVLGVVFMAGTGVVLWRAPGWVASWYSGDAAVVAAAMGLLPVAASFQVFDGTQAVAAGVLRGIGDLRVPAVFNLVGYYACGLPLAWWLGIRGGHGLVGLWTGLAVGLAVVATFLVGRLLIVRTRSVRRLVDQGV